MKTKQIQLVIFAMLVLSAPAKAESQAASATAVGESCANTSPVCAKWKAALPERFASDLRSCSEPIAAKDLALSCGKRIGSAFISYAKYQGTRQLMLQLTTHLGVEGAATSLVVVAGKVYFAYKAVQFVYNAFKKDAECFADLDFKRSILEPVAHFYTQETIEMWVKNRGCTDLGQAVYQKTQAVEQDISAKKNKQREFENYTKGRNVNPDWINRLFPEESRTLTPQQVEFVAKKERIEKVTPLFDAIAEIAPCLSSEALTRVTCGFVAQLGIGYLERGDIDIYRNSPDLGSAIKNIIMNGGPSFGNKRR